MKGDQRSYFSHFLGVFCGKEAIGMGRRLMVITKFNVFVLSILASVVSFL